MGIYLDEHDPAQIDDRERSGFYLARREGRVVEAPREPTWGELGAGAVIMAVWIVYAVGGWAGWW